MNDSVSGCYACEDPGLRPVKSRREWEKILALSGESMPVASDKTPRYYPCYVCEDCEYIIPLEASHAGHWLSKHTDKVPDNIGGQA